jgi:hypothetical protein
MKRLSFPVLALFTVRSGWEVGPTPEADPHAAVLPTNGLRNFS